MWSFCRAGIVRSGWRTARPTLAFEIDDAGLVADGFNERTQTQVAGPAQESFAGANDERQRLGREGVVAQPSAIELAEDERLDGCWISHEWVFR